MKCLILAIILLGQQKEEGKEVNCSVVKSISFKNYEVDEEEIVTDKKGEHFNFIEHFLNIRMGNSSTGDTEKGDFNNKLNAENKMHANSGRENKIYWTDDELKNDPLLPFKSILRKPMSPSNILGASRFINPNSQSIDRSSYDSTKDNSVLVEEMYWDIVHEFPALIDRSRDVIIKDLSTKTMLGYTIVVGFFTAAALETLSALLFGELFIFEAIFNVEFLTLTLYVWAYAWGYSGPSLFPVIFGSGDPNLLCSSQQFSSILASYNLDSGISSATTRPYEEVLVLTENLRRDLRQSLDCILSKTGDYQEASEVEYTLEEMLSLIPLHKKLGSYTTGHTNLLVLDDSLNDLWNELPGLVVDAHHAVALKRYEKNVISIIIGIWNVLGNIGVALLSLFPKLAIIISSNPAELLFSFPTSIVTFFSTGQFTNPLGLAEGFGFAAASFWGYGYWSPYLLYLEENDPGCGLADFQLITDRYDEDLRSISEMYPLLASQLVSNWKRKVRTALHCLVSQTEGNYLSDSINMWSVLAHHRIDLIPKL